MGDALLAIDEALDLPALADQALPERNVVVVDRHHGVGLPKRASLSDTIDQVLSHVETTILACRFTTSSRAASVSPHFSHRQAGGLRRQG